MMPKEKKFLLLTATILLATAVLLLSGCSNSRAPVASANGRIIPIRLSEGEQQVLATVGVDGMGRYFAFRISLPKVGLPMKENRYAHYWVDYYQNGKDKKIVDGETSLGNESNEGRISLALFNSDPATNTQDWLISCGNGLTQVRVPAMSGALASASTNGTDIVENKPVILTLMVGNESFARMIPQTAFGGGSALEDLIDQNKWVYVFHLELTNKAPFSAENAPRVSKTKEP
ncbi:hypothetical protein CEB3_c12290 [Peptococcaceae bacterium CEB3]|nr:hypothetical protein CEB3_c12290 [Peptococcaceae bacterium CEB3]